MMRRPLAVEDDLTVGSFLFVVGDRLAEIEVFAGSLDRWRSDSRSAQPGWAVIAKDDKVLAAKLLI